MEKLSQEEELVWNLIRAETHAQQALNMLYKPFGVKRGFWYRLALGRAQNGLIKLLVREMDKMGREEMERIIGA